ncbi:MAG: carboxypeptidase-like regulatory domain-containing protein [Bacteroidota bacterium]
MNQWIKYLFLFYCGLALNENVYAQQEIYIFGRVTSSKGEPLNGALITSLTGQSTISDSRAYYQLNILRKDSLSLKVQFVGYETLDTTVFPAGTDSLNINFQLTPALFDLPEITVEAAQQNLYERSNWVVIDYVIWHDQIILIALEGRKRWIYQYTLAGKLKKREQLSERYTDLHLSCLGGLHLIGESVVVELKWMDDEIALQNPYEKQKFESLLQACLFKWDNNVVFKNWSNHNQQVDYFYYVQQKAVPLYRSVNPQAIQLARAQFNKIIGLYYQAVGNPYSGGIINARIEKTNIIAEGLWDGDLFDLITPENNGVMRAITHYENTLARPLCSWEAVHQGKLLIFDFVQQNVSLFNRLSVSDRITLDTDAIKQIWKNNSGDLLQNSANGKIYFLSNDFKLFQLQIKKRKMELELVQELTFQGNYPKNYCVYQDEIYFLGNVSSRSPQNKLFSLSF